MTNNSFVSSMQKESNYTLTENGALAMASTMNDCVDLFGTIGALRSRDDSEIERLFAKAFAEDKLLATKMSFYARNILGGLGERRTAKVIWTYLAKTYPDIMRKNIQFIPYFGRWDDLYCLVGTPVEKDMWELVRMQYKEDVEAMENGKTVSLMAKWLKSCNSKNKEYANLGKKTARALHMSDKEYRKSLAALREHLNVVEVKMSRKDFSEIQYSAVPSLAMMKYRNAFRAQDLERYDQYLESLAKGETKVNANTLYPYNIIESYDIRPYAGNHLGAGDYNTLLEEQWKALPNYIEGENNVLVMADTSGSMFGRPLATSVGLAIYFAERNKGAFHNVFMTFSGKPEFVTLKGETLRDKVCSIKAIISNTDIEAAFDEILRVAVKNNISAGDMPKTLVIISDMEFDQGVRFAGHTYHDRFSAMYREAGYELPTVVYWNVASRHDVFHASSGVKRTMMVSGQSASTFKTVLANIGTTPYEAMVRTLNSEEYSMITV